MYAYKISEIIVRVVAVVLSLTIHEYAHGLASTLQGDDTPYEHGRLTLNPMAHIDILGMIALFTLHFGWAKPVPISSYKYKNPRRGIIVTSLAGPFANLLMAFLAALVWHIFVPESEFTRKFLSELFAMNTGLAVFNLIPFPPLDGSKVLSEIFGGVVSEFMYKLERGGTFILFLLLWLPPVQVQLSSLIMKTQSYIEYLAILIS